MVKQAVLTPGECTIAGCVIPYRNPVIDGLDPSDVGDLMLTDEHVRDARGHPHPHPHPHPYMYLQLYLPTYLRTLTCA